MNDLLQGQELSKKVSKRKLIEWGPEQQMPFDELKEACCVAPVLAYADYTQPFILHTDSSLDDLGASLYQKDLRGQLRVIAYASRSINRSETNYPAHMLEFLALKWAISDKSKEYLYGASSFEVFTDNNPLSYILTSATLDATTQRWIATLALYIFEIYYRSGKHKVNADSLSRIKWPESVDDVIANRNNFAKMDSQVVHAIFQGTGIPYGYVETISKSAKVIPESYFEDSEPMTLDKWKVEQDKDPTLHFLIQHLQEGILLKRKT